MNKKPIVGILITLSLISGLLGIFKKYNSENCIGLYVDYGILNKHSVNECLPYLESINAIDLLKQNNFIVRGTEKYGDAVLCRLNGLPYKEDEPCKTMPSEKAYWAVFEKKNRLFFENYAWSKIPINEINLNPGDSIALVFVDNGNVRFPN